MGETYIEDLVLDYDFVKLEKFLLGKLEEKLKGKYNGYYEFHKQKQIELIETNDGITTTGFNIFDFTIIFDIQEWKILLESTSRLIPEILLTVKQDYKMKESLKDFEDVFLVIKDIIREHSFYTYINSKEVDNYLKRGNLLFDLKEKLDDTTNYRSYLGGWGYINLPSLSMGLTISKTKSEQMEMIIDPDGAGITMPYDQSINNTDLLSIYFERLNLLKALTNIELQRNFHKQPRSVESELLAYISFSASEVFANYNREEEWISLAANFKAAKEDVDLYDIIHTSTVIELPSFHLESPSESKYKPGYTYVLKTQYGFFYLKDDNKVLLFKSLNEVYTTR